MGLTRVGGAVKSDKFVNTMSDMLSIVTQKDKDIIELLGYNSINDGGGGLFYWDSSGNKADHDGGTVIDPDMTFYTLGNETTVNNWYNGTGVGTGVWVRVTRGVLKDSWFGPLDSASYVYNEAFVNRKIYEVATRNTDYNDVTFEPKANPVFVWGSVNVGRSNLTIRHLMGCDIRGRYSDPSEAASGQAGHLFGFVDYTDPYPGTDYSIAGTVSNINYILDGKLSTIYNAGHTQLHNNNPIGFYDAENCSVTGTGGIDASDHNGISFDGLCVNPILDIAYIKDYDNRAVTMKGTSGTEDSAWVKVGSISGATGAGSTKEAVIVQDFRYAKVDIGTADLAGVTESILVKTFQVNKADIQCGYVQDTQFVVNIDETSELYLHDTTYSNTTYVVRRGGVSPAVIPLKRLILNRVTCKDSTNHILYLSQVASGTWDEFRVEDCDFSGASGTFTGYSGYVAGSAPSVFNFRNNKMPSGWVYDSKIWNCQLDRPNTAVGSSSFVYDHAGTNGDNPYKNITVIMTHSSDSSRYPVIINLEDLLLTGASYRHSSVADNGDILEISTAKSGTDITFTFTATAGTGSISSYSLSN